MNWTEELIAEAAKTLGDSHSVIHAAKTLGVTAKSLQRAFSRRGTPASLFLPKPAHAATVPDGHRLRGNSTLIDADDSVLKRWVKTERGSDDPPAIPAVPKGHSISKVSTLFDGQGQVRAQWVQAPNTSETSIEEFTAAADAAMKRYNGLSAPASAPTFYEDELLTAYPIGDPHIGMLAWHREVGEDFDLKIAEDDLTRVVDKLVDTSPSSYHGLLLSLGDLFHFENEEQRTPRGKVKLDADGRLTKVTEVGFTVTRRLVDRLLTKHQVVDVVALPGNHDPTLSRLLRMWLQAVYEREPRVVIHDNTDPYFYLKHGKTLLGAVHGDGAKREQLQAIMATDRPEDWGQTKYRYWLTGHIHHQSVQEYEACIVESFRTLASKDSWSHWKGYRAGRSLSSITYSKEYGEITRSTVDLRLGRMS